MRNDTVRLTNDINRDNLKNLGFSLNKETREYHCICQDKYFKYATKKVFLVVSEDFGKKYILTIKKEYDNSEVTINTEESIIHINIHTTGELITLLRALV
jgi:hypothetical protein